MFLMYQLKVAVILASFYLLYALLMRRETLHRLNRAVLLGSMVLSMILPLCRITIHRQTPVKSPAPQIEQTIPMQADVIETTIPVADVPMPQIPTAPTYSQMTVEIVEAESPQQESETVVAIHTAKKARTISWQEILFLVWALVALFFLVRLVVSVISTYNIIRKGRIACTIESVRVVVTRIDTNPFSWMNNIVLTQKDYDSPNADAIIEHELSHIRHRHSWDLLATDLYAAMQWFNPAIYDLRNSLQEVHEYQADDSVIRHGYNVKSYQMMLINKLALQNGFSIANNFSKKNLSNRISMMNKKNSPFARAWKALFIPVLTGLFLAATAVTVYDCTPGIKNGMDNEFKKLQERYGQGAFTAANYTHCNVVMLADRKNAKVTIGNSGDEQTVSLKSLPSYLEEQDNHEKLRLNICVQDWCEIKPDSNNTDILISLKPLLTKLESIKIRSLVVPTEEMMNEYYLSTYKYARIYETDDAGKYNLIHNKLSVIGDAKTMSEWIGLLDIQYVAFYTAGNMPISDAAFIMDAAKSRGVMSFFSCRISDEGKNKADNLVNRFGFNTTILPVNRNLKSEFKDLTLFDVAEELEKEYTQVYFDKAKKIVTNPPRISGEQWYMNMALLYCEDELIMILNPIAMSRNTWCRPDNLILRVDGKEYKMTKREGFQNFSDYPWDSADGYTNGSLCWGPDMSSMVTTIHFEPIPLDSKYMDILYAENRTYAVRGAFLDRGKPVEDAPVKRKPIVLDNYPAIGRANLENIPGTGSAYVSSVEFLKDRTNIVFNLRIEAPFDYPGYIGSDLTLTLEKNGKTYKIQGTEGGALDKDFDRGGDHVVTTVLLTFPVMEINDAISDMTQDDINRREPTPNGAEDMKTMTLEGTVCHQKVRIPITVPKIILEDYD